MIIRRSVGMPIALIRYCKILIFRIFDGLLRTFDRVRIRDGKKSICPITSRHHNNQSFFYLSLFYGIVNDHSGLQVTSRNNSTYLCTIKYESPSIIKYYF